MLAAVALVPGSPLLVPALTGPRDDDVQPVRTGTLRTVSRLAEVAPVRWVAVGVADPHDPGVAPGPPGVTGPDQIPTQGTYLGFGVDVRVRLSPGQVPEGIEDAMPTAILAAAWLRGDVAPGIAVSPYVVAADADDDRLRTLAGEIARIVTADDEPVGMLVVADGSTSLTPRAPGGFVEGAPAVQAIVDDAIAAADLDALLELDAAECAGVGLTGRAALRVAALTWRAARPDEPVGESFYRGAPFGVGYHAALWHPR
ncbi:class III extradiol ring-cleavage dioxygenase family protein [Williamsia deligens]|uniref:Uncharacterized protein n=1 Tax=Williamsia deligens TaxID=321325 RepID=A0ABW3GB88_9NOCA|nr:hypothetical protein [Williamsia deligens]MCP2195434.1 hypothetical protein [Williamsia deligens]